MTKIKAKVWLCYGQACHSCGHNLFNYQKAPTNFQVIETVLYPLMNTVIPGGRNRAEVY